MAKAKPVVIEEKGLRKHKKLRAVIGWILTVVLALLLSAVFAFAFCTSVAIDDSSMSPTIHAGDRVFLNRAAYRLGSVKRGDLIVYRGTNSNDIHVKRVIGLPGEEIQIRDGIILINGETYMEQNNFPAMINAGIAEKAVTLNREEYFVLGDDRNNSEDSRFPDVGNIAKSRIMGRAWMIIEPRDHIGLLR